jgi:predicted  nucleic acid-binding Zn-ribbon protein
LLEIKQLQAENQQLRQTSLSFEAQRQFFEEEFKQLKEYYEEIVQENERLSEDLRHQYHP